MATRRILLFAAPGREEFVERLAAALAEHGVAMAQDRGRLGGDGWDDRVRKAARGYDKIVLVWSREAAGDGLWAPFAMDAPARLKLVVVRADRTPLPEPMRALPAVDLSRWRTAANSPALQRLAALLRDELPHPAGPVARALHRFRLRLALLGGTFAICVPCAAFALNLYGAQDSVCALGALQPGLSDWCGELGLGGRPARAERLDWERLDRRDARALTAFINRHPSGVYHGAAADLLQACERVVTHSWVPQQSALPLLVSRLSSRAPGESEARALAVRLAEQEAESGCRALGLNDGFRYDGSAKARIDTLDCMPIGDSVGCEAEGAAVCAMERLAPRERLVCGQASR